MLSFNMGDLGGRQILFQYQYAFGLPTQTCHSCKKGVVNFEVGGGHQKNVATAVHT